MSIKAGQILHDANGFVVDRIQTGGAGNLNIPQEKIYELGNFLTVATIRDIPDLSFDLESLDVSTEIEALLLGIDPTTVAAGHEFDFVNAVPFNVISPFKSALGQYDIIRGLGLPCLNLENVTYRFGTRANATQAYTLRGDSIFYIPGSPYYAEYTVAAAPGDVGPYAFGNAPAFAYNEGGQTLYALAVLLVRADGTSKRLFHGIDYTDTATNFTLTASAGAAAGDQLRVIYGSATPANYPQTVHQDATVKPAAVRGKDIDVYVSIDGTAVNLGRWNGVQSFEVTRRVNLQNDEEFGNFHYVASDYDTADVTGNVVVRSRDVPDLFDKIAQVTGVAAGEVIGALSSRPLPLELRINDPSTHTRIKTLYVPDARFTPPPIQGRVQQKLDTTFSFTSDGGVLKVYAGARP